MKPDPRLYTSSQAGAVLGITREAVRLMVLRGELPCKITLSGRLFSRVVVDKLAEQPSGRLARHEAALRGKARHQAKQMVAV